MFLFKLKTAAVVPAVSLMVVPAFRAPAQETNRLSPDKSGFNLFNPTPETAMRELSPDRPDKTESPYTVDAGHFQLEMDFANYTYSDADGVHSEAWNVAPFNFKIGLLNDADVQFVFDDYLNVRTRDLATGAVSNHSGISDFTMRVKVNLWGDDGGRTAFALLPYVKLPTSTDHLGNNVVEGGAIFPLAVKLPAGFNMGCETAVGFWQDNDGSDYHEDFVNSLTFDHAIVGNLSGYLEFFSDLSTECHAGWIGTVDTGLEFLVTENVQLDCGCNFGVTRAADDYNPFVGITLRF